MTICSVGESCEMTPNANENGSDSFTITVNDGTVDVTEQ